MSGQVTRITIECGRSRFKLRWSVVLAVTLVALPVGAQVRTVQPVTPLVTPTTQGTSGPTAGGRSYITINWGDGTPVTTIDVASISWKPQTVSVDRMGSTLPRETRGFAVTAPENAAFVRLHQDAQLGRVMAALTLVATTANGQVEEQCVLHEAQLARWATQARPEVGHSVMAQATFIANSSSCTAPTQGGNASVAAPPPGNAVYGMPAPKQPN